MFERSEGPDADAEAADAEAVERIAAAVRQERLDAAKKLEAIADLIALRQRDRVWVLRERWVIDGFAAVQAEVACAADCSMEVAKRQMYLAWDLRTRLPRVAEVFRHGALPVSVVSAMTYHTHLIDDPAVLDVVDAELARQAVGYGTLSKEKAKLAIQDVVANVDPEAVRRSREKLRGRGLHFGKPDDATGTTSVYGSMASDKAAVLKTRLEQMIAGICGKDPRNRGQLLSDAAGALGEGLTVLECQCGSTDCDAPKPGESFAHIHVHVLTDDDALDTPPDPEIHGGPDRDDDDEPPWARSEPAPEPPRRSTRAEYRPPRPEAPQPVPPPHRKHRQGRPAGVILGGGRLTPAQVGDLVRRGASVRTVRSVKDVPAEPRYRFSAALGAFIRSRDLHCRFPNCEKPADRCDLDHTEPYPHGSTHASNGNCKCRTHHLLKTFWVGEKGWSEIQLPDGTIIITAPSGHTYRTVPGSWRLFPQLDTNSGPAPPGTAEQHKDSPLKGLKMPTRRATRNQQRDYRIRAERELNRKLDGREGT